MYTTHGMVVMLQGRRGIKYYKEQDSQIMEMQAQLDILFKVVVPFLMSEYIKLYSVD